MAALKKTKLDSPVSKTQAKPETVRVVVDSQDADPVASPAHELQKALHNAGYRSEHFRARPMSNAMLVASLVCVYALSMLMFFGSITA